MTESATELTRPCGRDGIDGDYRLIPAPVLFGGYLTGIGLCGQCGMADVTRRDLGWLACWGVPFIRTHAVTATKRGSKC